MWVLLFPFLVLPAGTSDAEARAFFKLLASARAFLLKPLRASFHSISSLLRFKFNLIYL